MSEEKVLTLRGKKAVWAPGGGSGPIDPKRLPEGYPYKEGVTIWWDGNTEGLESVADQYMGTFYKVSSKVLTDDEIKNGVFTSSDGNTSEVSKVWDQYLSAGYVTEDIAFLANGVFVRNPNAEVMGMSFATPGVYFVRSGDTFVTSFANETIHTMAPEFLPALTSPNGTKYQLTVADDGTLSAVAVS